MKIDPENFSQIHQEEGEIQINIISLLADFLEELIVSLINPKSFEDHSLKIPFISVERKLRYKALVQNLIF